MTNRMHDSLSGRSTIRVWEINVCPVDLRTLDQFGRENHCGGDLKYLVPRMGITKVL